ncbi:MAG TPA: DUF4398 domain-containing protein [Gammaproteobacteria bacterium]
MNVFTENRYLFVAVLGMALACMSACSSTPPPRPQLAQAERAVDQALTDDASEFAALEVRKAREKLQMARTEMQKENYAEATRLADEALVDAELARAKAEATKAQRAADELAQTIERLRHEAQMRINQPAMQ